MENKFSSFNKYEITPDIVDLVVESFLSRLILFRSYVRVEGQRKKSILNCSLEYPFIKEFFDRNFLYHPVSYESSDNRILKFKTPDSYEIITNIGNHLDTTSLYNNENNNELFIKIYDDEIDFIFVNLNALHKILFTLSNGVINNHYKKCNKELQRLEKAKSVAITMKKKNEPEFYTKDIVAIQDIIKEFKIVDEIINEKHSLIGELLKFCRTEMLLRARKKYSKRLEYCMTNKGVNSSDIIHLLDIKQQTYSDYINEKTLADNIKLIMLSKTLGCSIDFLLGLSDTTNYTAYRSHFAFNKFGFSAESFNKLSELRHNHANIYSDIINTFNHLLEEKNLETLYNISNYLKQADPLGYHTIKTTDLDALRDTISDMVTAGATGDKVKEAISDFKYNLPKQNITDDEATTLLNIQQNLIKLKKDNAANYYERSMKILSELWMNGHDSNEMNYHPNMFHDSEQDADDIHSSDSPTHMTVDTAEDDFENTEFYFENEENDYQEELFGYLPFDDDDDEDEQIIEPDNPYKD